MGAPKATATPAAHAALRISRRLAKEYKLDDTREKSRRTFIIFIFAAEATNDVANAAGDMNKWPFFAQGKTGRHRKRQTNRLCEQDSATKVTVDDKAYIGSVRNFGESRQAVATHRRG